MSRYNSFMESPPGTAAGLDPAARHCPEPYLLPCKEVCLNDNHPKSGSLLSVNSHTKIRACQPLFRGCAIILPISSAVRNLPPGRIAPSDLGTGTSAEIEKERRLLYVAMTRAKDDLHLITPQRFFIHGQHAQGDRHLYASRTRFIPEKLLGLFDRTRWPPAAVAATIRPAS